MPLALSAVLTATVIGGIALVTDRRATARETQAEAAFPPTGQMIDLPGGMRVHAHVQGTGPDLVLIHGASGNSRDFSFSLMDTLAQTYRVIAFDRPGLGWSDPIGDAGIDPAEQARVLQAAAAVLGVRQPIVLGHSYGGAVAMAWGLADPAGIGGLVIVSGATMPWPGGLGPFYAITASGIGGATVIPAITAFAPDARADDVIAGIFAPDAVPQGYAEYIGASLTMRRATLRANARQVGGLKPYVTAMARAYPGLTVPVEIVHGTADTIVPSAVHAIPLSALLPQGNLVLMDGAAHMPHHTHPDAILAAIDRAFAKADHR